MKTSLRNIAVSILGQAVLLCSIQLSAQPNANWKYIRPSNTGIGGDYSLCIKVDRCGNKWTGGYMPFWSEGSVTRFDDSTFTCWSNFEGYLPADRVYDLDFDSHDGLWVATNGVGNGIAHGGISHYENNSWVTYTSVNSPMPEDDMRGIAVDHNDKVWATFYNTSSGVGGVASFDGTNWAIYTPANSGLPSAFTDKIEVDAQNNIWIGTNAGLVKFNGSTWTTYNSSNSGLTSDNVTDVEIDKGTNKIYAVNGTAINIFDGNTWSYINSSNAPISATGLWGVDVRDGKIIIVTIGGTYRTYIYNGISWISRPENGHTYDARIDNEGNFWTCGIGAIMKYDGIKWTTYNSKNTGLTGMFNDDIFIDNKNRAWLASSDNGGINVFDCPRWQDYNPYNAGLWKSPVWYTGSGTGITQDSYGDIWMLYNGTLGAVVQIPGGNINDTASWVIWDNANSGIGLQNVKRAAADLSGNIWIGYAGACSVSKYERATNSWTNYNLYQLGQITCGAGSGIRSIRVDAANNVWICGDAGIAMYNQVSWTFYSHLNTPMLQGMVMDIAFDNNNNNKWIGTQNGLYKFDGTNWTNYNSSNSGLLNNFVTSVLVDDAGVVWTGSYDPQLTAQNPGGLNSFNGTTWVQYQPSNSGIQEKIIDRLAMDTLNNLWIMGGTHGVSIYNPNGINGYQCMDKHLTCFSVVPVTMEYFKGNSQLGKNYLTWKAECNATAATFIIERSKDNISFTTIGSLSTDISRCRSPFNFTDDRPLNGINYYRLKIIDGDDKISYSNVITLTNKKNGFELISLSPNPVSSSAVLSIFNAGSDIIQIIVRDMLGKTVYLKKAVIQANAAIPLELQFLAKGIYSLTVNTAKAESKTIKFVKQ